jgi:hypothetical protein
MTNCWRCWASPRVCQINLASIYFWQNRKNCVPTVWYPTWQILATWQIFPLTRIFARWARARIACASGFSCIFKRGSSFLSGALCFLAGLFVRLAGLFLFYQVQMANSWRESIFLLTIYFSKLPNHDICQVNFGKLLKMTTKDCRPRKTV